MTKTRDYFNVMALEDNGKAVTATVNGEILMHFDSNLLSLITKGSVHESGAYCQYCKIRMPV